MTCCKRTFFTSRAPMLFVASRRGALLIMPPPFSGGQIKAEIKGFLLRCRLFQYYQWFFHNLEVSRILVLSDAPCICMINQTMILVLISVIFNGYISNLQAVLAYVF